MIENALSLITFIPQFTDITCNILYGVSMRFLAIPVGIFPSHIPRSLDFGFSAGFGPTYLVKPPIHAWSVPHGQAAYMWVFDTRYVRLEEIAD